MYGDSKRAQRFYQQDSDAEEEEELLPNPKLAAGDLVLQKVPSEANPKVRNHGEGPY